MPRVVAELSGRNPVGCLSARSFLVLGFRLVDGIHRLHYRHRSRLSSVERLQAVKRTNTSLSSLQLCLVRSRIAYRWSFGHNRSDISVS